MTPNPMLSFLPLLLLTIPIAIISYHLAKEKGKNIVLWTLLSIMPFFNGMFLAYLIGAKNLIMEKKVDRLLEILDKHENLYVNGTTR